MIEKIKTLILKIIGIENDIFFVGSTDKLPEPLTKEEEVQYVLLSMNGDKDRVTRWL